MTSMELIRTRLVLEEGQALVEYALLIALIALAAVGALTLVGDPNPGVFSAIANKLP